MRNATEAQRKAEKKIAELTTQICLRFRSDRPEDVELLEFVRSQAEKGGIPEYIKRLIEKEMDR